MSERDCTRCPHPLEEHRVPIDDFGGYEYGPCRLCDCERILWPHSLEAASWALNDALSDLWREISRPFRRLLGRMRG